MMEKDSGEDKNMEAIIKRPNTPAESLKESLREVQLIRQGKKKGKTWRQLRDELKKED
ncbi:hypothetical protein J2Z22_003052 [Paenibacillus forsythiae]|uniref:Uncharacterized protein n=1 Tax=Paenibacillus forsythiae TaxID=365616 RepID=A0ABU3H9K7_9BACL|nr:hypothetical protein [Paenibacillus forsythiae]MDT3427489.1 hypothetical protein [Paenibacillus forsythiae]